VLYHRQSAIFGVPGLGFRRNKRAGQTMILSVPGSDTKQEPLLDPGVEGTAVALKEKPMPGRRLLGRECPSDATIPQVPLARLLLCE